MPLKLICNQTKYTKVHRNTQKINVFNCLYKAQCSLNDVSIRHVVLALVGSS